MTRSAEPKLLVLTAFLATSGCSGEGATPTEMPEAPASTTAFVPTPTVSPNGTPESEPVVAPPIAVATSNPTSSLDGPSPDATTALPAANGGDTVVSRCEPGTPTSSQVPRLTNAQYNRTIRDLLGAGPSGLLATEQAGDITKAEWDGYRFSADELSRSVMADPELRERFIQCVPEGDGAACLSETILSFGLRAYRRPLSAEETAGYESLVERRNELTATGSFEEVAELVLNAFLKSPHFIQRSELSEIADRAGNFVLTDYEVASRLSYMLWGTMPDQTLFDAAARGELRTAEQVLEQAGRMVEDDKARPVMSEFHRAYLLMNSGRWSSAQKDPALFPLWSQAVVADMNLETEMLFDAVFETSGTFTDLLTTNTAYVTANTAPFYGLDASDFDETPRATELDGSRPGLLTRIGFLAAYGDGDKTDIINRGAFITKEILGIDPGIPDPAAATAQLPDDATLDTMRKKVTALTEEGVCATCHIPLINPPGFVLEAFDTTGAAQTTERSTGAPIDTRAEVLFAVGEAPESIAAAVDLMRRLAEVSATRETYAAKLVAFAYDRSLTGPDLCTAEQLATHIARGDSLKQLVAHVSQSNYFLTRAVEVTP